MASIGARIRLILRLVAGVLAFLVYAWAAAVRLLPEVKRRKALRRGRRKALRRGPRRRAT